MQEEGQEGPQSSLALLVGTFIITLSERLTNNVV